MDILKGVLASLLAVLLCGFWPGTRWIAEQAIERAVGRLPETHREGMREEWYGELDAYPGGFWTLCWALDLVRGASTLALEMEKAEASQAEAQETAAARKQQEEALELEPTNDDPELEVEDEEAARRFFERIRDNLINKPDFDMTELRKKLEKIGAKHQDLLSLGVTPYYKPSKSQLNFAKAFKKLVDETKDDE